MKLEEPNKNRDIFLSLENIDENTRQGIRQGFFRLGRLLQMNLRKEVIKRNKTGRVYSAGKTKKGRQRRHRASAPGETPANRSGNYRKNIGYQIHGSESMEFGVREGVEYAVWLEEGTKDKNGNVKIAPRPGVGNTVKDTEKDAQRFFDSALESELN